MYPKKAGASLKVIPEEGKVVIQTIKETIPKTFSMVEQASFDAEQQGYVILNNRTKSRAWFPYLIKQLRKEITKETNFLDISGDLSAARNIRIQGTQADFVKEASVVLNRYFEKNYIDAKILSWIHDELVIQLPLHLDGQSQEYTDFAVYNPNYFLKSPITGKLYPTLPELIIDIMEEVANKYLHNIRIKVDYKVKPHWVK